MKSGVNSIRTLAVLAVFSSFLFVIACEKSQEDQLHADFSYELQEGNIVRFTNESEGDYFSASWNFGNGQSETTSDKNYVFEIYYPDAGNYRVNLKLTDYIGNNDTISKVVSIANSDIAISFTAEVDSEDPNLVNLVNTSEGGYESFKWKYRNREKENDLEYTAYFPFSGNHEIELELVKSGFTFSSKKYITISEDDPDYLDKLTLSWSDEFDGPSVDSDNWTFETGSTGWGNKELQKYTNGDNAEIVDGILVLTAEKLNNNTETGSYASTRINTKNKQEFTYGRMEIRAKLPSGRGIWPAIWMLGSNFNEAGWPECGEIDIMEYVGYEPNVIYSTVHTPSGFGVDGNGSSKVLSTCEEEFHIYGAIWTEEEIVFYTDTPGNVTHTYAPALKNSQTWPYDLPQFFVLNIAVGGDWGGAQGIDNSIFPTSLEIDYVRIYQEAI